MSARLGHLARRFAGSLRPGPPGPADDRWARSHLGPGEQALWDRMSEPDRRHGVAVARDVVARLGPVAGPEVVAAALLHDVGKVVAGLGTFPRVAATVVWAVLDPARARPWSARPGAGIRARLGRYRLHPELGEGLLAAAGAHPLTAAWAADHHLAADCWRVPPELGAVLKACDDD